MSNLIIIDTAKMKYTPEESKSSFKQVCDEIMGRMNNKKDILQLIILHMFINNHRDSNIFHIENFQEELEVLKPYLLSMNKFIKNVSLNNITDENKKEFKNIQEFLNDYVVCYEYSKVYFREHILTMPAEIALLKKLSLLLKS